MALTRIPAGGVVTATTFTFNSLNVTATTVTASTITGALVISGGLGIGGNGYIGGNLTVLGTINATITGIASSATNLAGGTAGQIPYQTGIGATSFFGPGSFGQFLMSNGTGAPLYQSTLTQSNGNIIITSNTAATSTGTGALQIVNGGLGVGGDIYANTFNTLNDTANTTLATFGGTSLVNRWIRIRNTGSAGFEIGQRDGSFALAGAGLGGGAALLKAGNNKGFAISVNDPSSFDTIASAAFWIDNGGTTKITATTATNSTATGALQVGGGIGVGGGGYFGGVVTATTFVGALTGTASTATSAGTAYSTIGTLSTGTGIYGSSFNGSANQTWSLNTATLMQSATQVVQSLSTGTGIFGSSFNGSTAQTWSLNTATLMQVSTKVVQAHSTGTGILGNSFDGSTAVTWSLNTATLMQVSTQVVQSLSTGTGILGNSFNGSTAQTWTLNTSTLMANAVTAINLAGGSANQFAYQTGAGATAFVSTGSMYVSRAVFADSASGSAGSVANAVTFNSAGTGDASGTTYNGSAARTISYNTLGAMPTTGGTFSGPVTFNSPVTFGGTATYVLSTNTFYTDNIIELHVPPAGVNAPWFADDGKDIGLRFHYYRNSTDTNAALVLDNTSGYLDWYSSGAESGTGDFSTATYGVFRSGSIKLVGGASNSGNTTTGDLTVLGGIGVGGGAFFGGIVTATTFVGALSQVHTAGTGLSGSTYNGSAAVTWTLNTATLMANAVTAINLAGGSAGQFAYQTGAGATSFMSTGSMYVNSAVNAEKLYAGTAMSLVYQSAANTTAFLAAGTSGYVLQTNGTGIAPSWVAATGLTAGIATTATQLNTQLTTASATYYPTFVDANNASATAELHYTTSSFIINPATGQVGINTASFSTSSKLTVYGRVESVTDVSGEGGQFVMRSPGFGYRWSIDNYFGAMRIIREDDVTEANGASIVTITSGTSNTFVVGGTAGYSGEKFAVNGGAYVNGTLTATTFVGALSQVHTAGTGLSGSTYNGSAAVTWTLNTATLMASAVSAINLSAGSAMALPYQSASGTTAYLAAGTSGYVLQTNGTGSAPSWVAASGLSAASASQVNTVAQTASGTYYPVFVNANNASATAMSEYTTSTFTINPATGVVGINGVGGTALSINVPSTNTDRYFLNATAAVNSFSIYDNANTPYLNSYAGMTLRANQNGGTGGNINLTGGNVYVASNLGVGASAPGYKLVVSTSITSATTTASSIGLHLFNISTDSVNGNTSPNQIGIGFGQSSTRSAIISGTYGNDYLDFFTNGELVTSKLRIRASGAMAFSGNGNYGSSGQILQSNGDAAPTWVAVSGLSAGSVANALTIGTGLSGTSGTYNGSAAVTVSLNTATYMASAALATTASKVANAHSAGTGLTGSAFDGSAAQTWTLNTATLMATAVNLGSGTAMAIPYQSAANTTAFLAAGTAGYVLTTNGTGSAPTWVAQSSIAAGSATDSTKLPLAGGTMTGNILFGDSGTTKRGIQGTVGANDMWFVGGGATASNSGWMEIATGDDGQSAGSNTAEPIMVSQYGPGDPLTGTLYSRAFLATKAGNHTFPNNFGIGFNKTAAPYSETEPSAKLHVAAAADGESVFKINGQGGTNATVKFADVDIGGQGYGGAYLAWGRGGSYDNWLMVFTRTSGNVSSERLRITANGGVAFGGAANYGSSGQILQSNGDAAPTWVNPSTLASASATNADNLKTIQQTASGTYYPSFVDSNNATAAYEAHYTTSSFYINPANGLTTIAAPAGGDGLPSFRVTQGTAPSSFNWIAGLINSSLGSSRNLIMNIGQAESNKNCGYIGFNHSGTAGSVNNFLTLGLHSVDNILNITGNGFVGIGNTAPAYKLSVNTAADVWHAQVGTSGGKQLRIGGSTTNGSVIGAYNTDDNSSPASLLLNRDGGNVGINTGAPVGKLSVVMSDATAASNVPGNVSAWDSTYALFGNAASTTGGALGIGYNATYGSTISSLAPAVAWKNLNILSNDTIFYTNGVNERMRINSSGGIAFGGASNYGSSGQILQSNGNAAPTWVSLSGLTAGTASTLANFTAATSANGLAADSPNTIDDIGYVSSNISLYANGSAGTQSDGGLYVAGYSTSWYHQIYGDFRTGSISVRGKNSGTWQAWRSIPTIHVNDNAPSIYNVGDFWWESDTGRLKIYYHDGSSGQWVDAVPVVNTSLFFSKSGGAISGPVSINGALDVTGNITATAEITAYYSDRRLKTDVLTIENALVKVKKLNGVTYRPNELAESYGLGTNSDVVGLFADEVEQVLPQAVKPAPFDIDENGNSKSGENYKTIQYEKVVPLLVEAIKEQQSIIEAQQAKIDRLMKHLGLED